MIWGPGWRPCGEHDVGVVDVSAVLDSVGENALSVSGRLFYPADFRRSSIASGFSPITWIGHYQYAWGLSCFLTYSLKPGLYRQAIRAAMASFFFAVGSTQFLHARYGASLLEPARPAVSSHGDKGEEQAGHVANADAGSGAGGSGGSGGYPVVLLSHGIGGQRNTYSCTCSDLASMGYVVFAVEHADGTACAVRRADHPRDAWWPRWSFYSGLGDKASQLAKTAYRVHELRTALRALRLLNLGQGLHGVTLHGMDRKKASLLQGHLDLSRVGVVGHSYGGASAAAAVAQFPEFGGGVALDPWWGALPPDNPALTGWATTSPLLVVGSQDWNTPTASGNLKCDGEKQEMLLRAAASRAKTDQGSGGGGGAMLIIPRGTTHHSFDDSLLLFGERLSTFVHWIVPRSVSIVGAFPPATYHRLNVWSIHNFLSAAWGGLGDQAAASNGAAATAAGGPHAALAAAGGVPQVVRPRFAKEFGDMAVRLEAF